MIRAFIGILMLVIVFWAFCVWWCVASGWIEEVWIERLIIRPFVVIMPLTLFIGGGFWLYRFFN